MTLCSYQCLFLLLNGKTSIQNTKSSWSSSVQNGQLLPWTLIHQPVWQPVIPGKTTWKAWISKLCSLHLTCLCVTGHPLQGTADHVMHLFLKMVNNVKINPYRIPVSPSDRLPPSQKHITSRFIFKCKHFCFTALIWSENFLTSCIAQPQKNSQLLISGHVAQYTMKLLEWRKAQMTYDSHWFEICRGLEAVQSS
jgi:hypothetical protein